MTRALRLLLALVLAANGVAMLFAGPWWYAAVPGVTQTGPFNGHFVKDIGAAYLVAGGGFAWLGARAAGATSGTGRGAAARGAAIAGAAFLALHALIHLAEAAGAPAGLSDLARDFRGVIAPALLALALAWPFAAKSET
jgi:hypothetical protein